MNSSAVGRRRGLQTVADLLVAPNAAFAALREIPTWGWAYIIACALSMLATFALTPALLHALEASMPAQLAASHAIASLPPDQQQKQIAGIMAFQRTIVSLSWLFPPILILIAGLLQSVVMLVANAVGRGDGSFRYFWALALNVQVAGSIGSILTAAIVLVRGPNAFDRSTDLQAVLPNVGMLVPGAPPVVAAVLTALNVAALWQTVLLALGMIAIARIAAAPAWVAAVLMLLTLCAFAAFGANAQAHAS